MDTSSTSPPSSIQTLELDKICRVCLTVKKDMRPLFSEMIAEMLMECARIQVDDTDGWPDRICIQCVHQVSRCHAFKSRVEKSDQELRQYIKGITVIVEEQIELQPQPQQQQTQPQSQQLHQIQTHQITRADSQNPHHVHIQVQPQIQHTNHRRSQQQQQPHQQQRQIIRAEIAQHNDIQPQQMIITNGQLHNAQIINAGQIVTTSQGQQIVQTTGTQNVQAGQNVQLCQLVTTGNGTMQVIQPNGQPAQVVQIQRTSDDRCEIIVQPDIQGETQYYTEDDLKTLVTVTQSIHQDDIHEEEVLIEQIEEVEELEEMEVTTIHTDEHEHEQEQEQEQELEQEEDEILDDPNDDQEVFTLTLTDDSECEDKEYLAEFISMQTSCPYPGRFICNLCRKEFKHSKWLNSHMKSHSNWIKANCKKQPQCQICFRSFKGPGMLRMHMKTHEKPPDKIPTCTVCNKEFKSKTILYRHRQTHLEKLIQCGTCQKSFSTIGQLQSHQTKTNHEKIIKCSHCVKTYTNITELKQHLLIHQAAKEKTINLQTINLKIEHDESTSID